MKVLLIEDNQDYAFLVEALLQSYESEPVSLTWAETLQDGIHQLQRDSVDVILLDLSLPDSSMPNTLATLKSRAGLTPIIVLTGCDDEQCAIDAMRLGAQDFLLKTEIDKRGLKRALRYAMERRHFEDKYRELVESVDTIVWEADPVTWRFTFVNVAAERILGYPIMHWLETADFWVNLIHPADRLAAVDYCRRHIDSGDRHEFEYRAIARDGRVVWLRDIVRVIRNASGQPILLRGIMVDITRDKDATAELQKKHSEAEALQEVSRIVLESAEPQAGIEKALEKCVVFLGFDLGDVLLTTPAGELLSVVAAWGYRNPANRDRTARPQSSMNRRTQLTKSEVIGNLQRMDRFRSLKKEGAETALIVPLRSASQSLGVLQLASRGSKEIHTRDVALAEAIGRQIGIAIQKAKLTDELQTSLRNMKRLYESSMATNSTLDLSAILDILLEQIDIVPLTDTAITVQLMDVRTGAREHFVHRNIDESTWNREFGSAPNLLVGGITKHTLESENSLVIEDLCADSRVHYPEFFRAQSLVSYLGVPIRVKDRAVGVVGIYTRRPHQFRPEETSAITALASHAAVAINNAQLYAEVDKKSQELATLVDVTTAASQSLDANVILREVGRRINETFGFDATRVFLFDDAKEHLVVCASYESRESFSTSPQLFLNGQGISGHVGATGEAIVIENIEVDARYEQLTQSRTGLKTGRKFVASFPIKYQNEVLGVISCVGRQPRQLTDHELHLIASMSGQAAIAVHNARLYAAVEKQSQELSALFDVTAAATQSLEMDSVLHDVIRRIMGIFQFDATRFYLFDDRQERLHCRASDQVNSGHATRTVSFKKGEGITGQVGATGNAIVINDTETDPRYQRLSRAKKTGQRFIAGFPVKYGSETLGVIMCLGDHPRQLNHHEIDLIASLSSQIAVAIANARLYGQSKAQAEQLRNLAMYLESVREYERTRISRELHDELGQALTGLKFDVAWLNGKLSDSQAALASRLGNMSKSLDNTIQTVRKISSRLRPDILDKLGLSAAIEWQLQEFRQRTGVHYHFHSDPIEIRLSEQHSTALFRILQEALTNTARHSHASRVRIALEVESDAVFLRVDDNGNGIELHKVFNGQSLGLLGMRERAAALGGSITIERKHEGGTTVTARLPLVAPSENLQWEPRSAEL